MGLEDRESVQKDGDAAWTEETRTYRRPRREVALAREGRALANGGRRVSSDGAGPGSSQGTANRERITLAPKSRDLRGERVSGEATIVIVEHRAVWPRWLATELAGEADALILVQQAEEALPEFSGRVTRRLQRCSCTITSMLWLVPGHSHVSAEFSRRVCGQLSLSCEVRRVITERTPLRPVVAAVRNWAESGELPAHPGLRRAGTKEPPLGSGGNLPPVVGA